MKKISNEMLHHVLGEIKTDVSEIKAQTIKTNGRVSALEGWRAYITGGLAVITIILIPILLHLYNL